MKEETDIFVLQDVPGSCAGGNVGMCDNLPLIPMRAASKGCPQWRLLSYKKTNFEYHFLFLLLQIVHQRDTTASHDTSMVRCNSEIHMLVGELKGGNVRDETDLRSAADERGTCY